MQNEEKTIIMQNEERVQESSVSHETDIDNILKEKISEIKLQVDKFIISPKKFRELHELAVVKEFFLLNDDVSYAVNKNKEISSKDIEFPMCCTIVSTYRTAMNMYHRREKSMLIPDKETRKIFMEGYSGYSAEKEMENILIDLSGFELVFNINNFDDLMNTMEKINEFHIRVLRIWSKVTIIPIKGFLSNVSDVFYRNIATRERGSLEYKLTLYEPEKTGNIKERSLENINPIKSGSYVIYSSEVHLGCKDQKLIRCNQSETDYRKFFNKLKKTIPLLLGEEFNEYSKFDVVLDLLERVVDFFHKFFFTGTSDFFDSEVCWDLSKYFISISKSLISFIDFRYCCDPRVIEIGDLALLCCDGLINQVNNAIENTSSSAALMKNAYDFVFKVKAFRQQLGKHKYCDNEFWRVTTLFELEFKVILLNLNINQKPGN